MSDSETVVFEFSQDAVSEQGEPLLIERLEEYDRPNCVR
jgi:hypothetical protein